LKADIVKDVVCFVTVADTVWYGQWGLGPTQGYTVCRHRLGIVPRSRPRTCKLLLHILLTHSSLVCQKAVATKKSIIKSTKSYIHCC